PRHRRVRRGARLRDRACVAVRAAPLRAGAVLRGRGQAASRGVMRTRLAPSPTGALHVGNARTFLLTWLHARAAGGSIVYRIDDLDGPRVKAGRERDAIDDL